MLTRSAVIVRDGVIRSGEAAHVQSRPPLLVSMTLSFVLVTTVLIVTVVLAARVQQIPQLPDIPQIYLPGNPIPTDVTCYTPSDEHFPRCSVRIGQTIIFVDFHPDHKTITGTLIPAREYTIGQIVTVWGKPTGITRKETMVYVYWGARSALIYTRDFQPNNVVEFIQYDLEPASVLPWQGFRLFE